MGLGLFMPATGGAVRTEDIVFDGPTVVHCARAAMESWQAEYAIMDLFNQGYVFVPKSLEHMHPGFRVQHSFAPSHQLTQTKPGPVSLVQEPGVELGDNLEITFNYGEETT